VVFVSHSSKLEITGIYRVDTTMISAILWGGLAAASLLIGFVLAGRGLSNRSIGMVMGIGSGALLSAIAYELIPESSLHGWGAALGFILGALAFFGADWWIDHRGGGDRKDIAGEQRHGSGSAIFIGTLLDNIPESMILGMGLSLGGSINIAFLAAVFISNLPEGVAGTLNLENAGYSRREIFWRWAGLVGISAACAGLGYGVVYWLPGAQGYFAKAFAAGAMLTMLADAMMPEAFEHGGKLVGLFTVMGFLLAAILAVAG
jgi:ZIP family zinc transporter